MGLIILLLFYVLPIVICLFFAYKIKADKLFSKKMEITTWLGLGIILLFTTIPLLNLFCAGILTAISIEHKAFGNSLNIHKD